MTIVLINIEYNLIILLISISYKITLRNIMWVYYFKYSYYAKNMYKRPLINLS